MPWISQSQVDRHFPKAGLDVSRSYSRQPYREVRDKEYAYSAATAINVLGFEPSTGRLRGGSRSGQSRWIDAQVTGQDFVIQDLELVVTTRDNVQLSQSGRLVLVVAVVEGRVFYASPGDTAWTEAANNTGETPPLNYSGIIFSAQNIQKLWFADGINYAVFTPATGSVDPWVATKGTLPADNLGNTPRLIETWRGRTVLSGLLKDPQDWFMSAVNDPTDFDYSPVSQSSTQAVAGASNGPQGFVGDCVTGLLAYSDDVLLFFGDHTIYRLQGDPLAGGQIDLVTATIGAAWGRAFCMDPYGTIYFFSNRCGVYQMAPRGVPQRISRPIDPLLEVIDTGNNSIRLIWSDKEQGFYVFVTPLNAPGTTTHYFYEARTGAWWQVQFGNSNLDPLSCVVVDGNGPDDRRLLLGGWDGYVRELSSAATTDDGTAINSEVWLGPFLTPLNDDVMIYELQAVMGELSDPVTYAVFTGATSEAALSSGTPVATGTWLAGRNGTVPIRKAAHALYVRITSQSRWSMESIRVRIGPRGRVRQRSRR